MRQRQPKGEQQQLRLFINKAVDTAWDRNGKFRTPELVTSIVAGWSESIAGPDEDNVRASAYIGVSKVVADVVRGRLGENEQEIREQCSFPDFPLIHRAYQVDGETIRADKLTVAQAMRVIEELRRVQRGTELHIHEMQRFIDEVLIPKSATGE
jgi:hypothetical protein